MTAAVRVAAIDDHPIFLAGLRDALERLEGIAFVAEGHTAEEAERIAGEQQVDVMLLDVAMPGSGIEAVRKVLATQPSIRVIMLSAAVDDDTVSKAIELGANGYLAKGCVVDELHEAIMSVHAGGAFITPSVSSLMLVRMLRPIVGSNTHIAIRYQLNHRETTVIDLVANGKSNKEISTVLNLAQSTVRNALSSAFAKMHVDNRLQAVVKCYNT